MVRVGGRCEGWINPSAWRLCLGVGHEGVIHAYWGGRVVVLVDRASAGVLVTIHKHVQECLQSRGRIETFNYLGIVKKTIGPVTDSHHPSATAVDVNAVHVAEGQTDVCG